MEKTQVGISQERKAYVAIFALSNTNIMSAIYITLSFLVTSLTKVKKNR